MAGLLAAALLLGPAGLAAAARPQAPLARPDDTPLSAMALVAGMVRLEHSHDPLLAMRIAATEHARGNHRLAAHYYQVALGYAHGPELQAHILAHLGQIYQDEGNAAQANLYFHRSVQLMLTAPPGNAADEAEALKATGRAALNLDDPTDAQRLFERALKLNLPTLGAAGAAMHDDAMDGLGRAELMLGRPRAALANFQSVLQRCQPKARDGRGPHCGSEAAALSDRGLAAWALDQKTGALQDLQQAVVLYQTQADREDAAAAFDRLGRLYGQLDDYEAALDNFRRAEALAAQAGLRDEQAAALNQLGRAEAATGHYAQALSTLEHAVQLDGDLHRTAGQGRALLSLGNVYAGLNQPGRALDYYRRALAQMRAAGQARWEAEILSDMGDAQSASGQGQAALDLYAQALPKLAAAGDQLGEAVTLGRAMAYWTANGNPALAILFGKQAINLYQHADEPTHGPDDTVQRSYLAARESDYRGLANLLIHQNRMPEGEQVLGRLKLQESSDYGLTTRGGPSPVSAVAYTDAEQNCLGSGASSQAAVMALGVAYDKEHSASTLQQLSAANQDFRQYLAGMTGSCRGYRRDNQTITADNRQLEQAKGDILGMQPVIRHAPPGTVAAYTLVLPDELEEILITPRVSWHHSVRISEATLNRTVANFTSLFANPQPPAPAAVRQAGFALYQILFNADFVQALQGAGAHTILWSLDGELRYVPLPALWDGSSYLADQYQSVRFVPGVQGLDQPPALAGATGLAMGVSKPYVAPLRALPEVPAELDQVVRDAQVQGSDGPVPGTILLDQSFTLTAMEAQLTTQPRLVHIATHYVFASGNAATSFLVLGGDAAAGQAHRLSLAELENDPGIDFDRAVLVTLSGCQTGVPGGRSHADGHEVDSLSLVILRDKGAQAVIASLWKVADQSAEALMGDFYRHWLTAPGMTKAAALQLAEQDLEHNPKFSNPYFWAPFILTGNWQ